MMKIGKQQLNQFNVDLNMLNEFYLRFEKQLPTSDLLAISQSDCPQLKVEDVISCLRTIDIKECLGPDGIPGKC